MHLFGCMKPFWFVRLYMIVSLVKVTTAQFVCSQTIDLANVEDCLPVSFARMKLDDQCSFVSVVNLRGACTNTPGALFFMNRTLNIELKNSRFDLYDERNVLIEANRCNAEYFGENPIGYMSHLNKSALIIDMNKNDFNRPVCPFFFKNADVYVLSIYFYGNNDLFRNEIIFYEIEGEANLNASIKALYFDFLTRHQFKRGSVSPLIFSFTLFFGFSGLMSPFGENFFVDFKSLSSVELKVENTREFFHASDNRWLTSLFIAGPDFEDRDGVRQNASEYSMITVLDQSKRYDYPAEDFCLFRHFPRRKAVLGAISLLARQPSSIVDDETVSCTYRFLSQNNLAISSAFTAARNSSSFATFTEPLLNACQFELKLSACANASVVLSTTSRTAYFYYTDVLYVFNWIEYVGPVITFPLLLLVAFFLNLLVILSIRSKKNQGKLFESKMFKLIEMNSAFNCVECLISQFKLAGMCLGLNSVFCSSVRDSSAVFYLGVANIYLIEVMKSCSILTGLLFSIQRFLETSKSERRVFKAFARLKTSTLAVLVLAYGFSVSTPVFFNVSFIRTAGVTIEMPSLFYLQITDLDTFPVETYFYFAYYVTNDFLILSLNLAFDCGLVQVVKADLGRKHANKVLMIRQKNDPATEAKKIKEAEMKKASVEHKINAMLVFSVLVYLVCRLPELAINLTLYYFYRIHTKTCMLSLLCYVVYNSIQYVYMLSYIFNVILFYKFNTNLRKGFKNYIGLKSRF